MNKKQTTALAVRVFQRGGIQKKIEATFGVKVLALFVVIVVSLFCPAGNAVAQTLRFKSGQDVVTVPAGFNGSAVVTNQVTISGLGGNYMTLSLSGLPTGITGAITDLAGNPVASTNTSTGLKINLTGAGVADGAYTFSINASGLDTNSSPVANSLNYTLEAGYIWNGSTNVALDGPGSWTDSAKWLGGGVPDASSDVVIADSGSQTNFLVGGALKPNIVVNSDATVGSIRFSATNSGPVGNGVWQTLGIGGGKTLSVVGANGFSVLRDYIADSGYGNMLNAVNVVIAGTNGAMLVVSNETANFSVLTDTSGNNRLSVLDMSPLDNLVLDVSRMALGDYTAYPNYMNFSIANSYNGVPRRFLPNVNLAKTNIIKAVFADPYNYTNGINRQFSVSFLNSEQSGSSTQPNLLLGIDNEFYVDSVNFVGANQQGNVRFNAGLRVATNIVVGVSTNYFTNSMSAYFRGTNGGTMSLFSISDCSGTNGAGSNAKATVDFSLGSLNIMADRFYIGRDRPKINGGQNPNYQGFFIMGNGSVEVNNAILGFQEYSDQTNQATFNGYCEGSVTILSNGLFQVNDDLILGYCTQTNTLGLGSAGNTTYGKLFVYNGGTLTANKIEVGIPAYTSANNLIVVSNNSTLVVSNTIASTNKMLDSLSFYNSTLSLSVDGTATTPYVFATNLVTVGNNTINIMSVANPGSVAVPLIRYVTPGATFSTLNMPGGLVGVLIDDGVGTFYLNILTNAPKTLTWRGYSDANWDLTTKNWLDSATGLHTNFANGDNVTFDDAASIPTTVNAAVSTLIVGSMTITNTANAYVFNGSGNIVGSAVKKGSNSLEIDDPSSLNIEIDNGSLTGSGTLGQVTVLSGAQMNYTGNLKGGILCGGIGTVSGNVVGSLTLQAGGVFTNKGTINNSFTTANGSLLVNELNAEFRTFASSTIVSNSIVINRGYIGGTSQSTAGQSITVNNGGMFEDTGEGWLTMNGTLTIASGATFIPGGDGVGTTYVYKGTAAASTFPARVIFAQGSTNIFKVNKDLGTYTRIGADFIDYGGSASVKSYNGGTLQFVNVGSLPYAAGDSFNIAFYSESGGAFSTYSGTATNTYPILDPPAPASGLAWNINNLTLGGTVKIVGVSTNTFNLGFVPTFTTLVTTNSTNNVIIGNLSWPGTNTGWRLQQLQTALTNGLSATNWQDVFGSAWTNNVVFTNNIATNTATFYRMVYP
ncbi:MAG TPA: hypothetical protein VFV23_02320 [Verrucomicrobiae bacterium]|nr:hypothetical protein [Verrucomicrobiae bacterium]